MSCVCWNVLVRMEYDCGQAKEREEGSEGTLIRNEKRIATGGCNNPVYDLHYSPNQYFLDDLVS